MKIWLSQVAAFLVLLMLYSCNSANPKIENKPPLTCCGGLNLSSLVEGELIKCGTTYGGNGFNRRWVEKSERSVINIVRCAKSAQAQGRSYLVEYNFAMLPDYEVSDFVIFKPDNSGVVVSYNSDGETNWYASVKNCPNLVMLRGASTDVSKCGSSSELEYKLGIQKRK